ncbi:MAG: hypothetical protein MZV70_73300 [Desulfobacterales bacterium]|nr:hypothetical protein [Desulfobacterales bacterium]
MDSNASSLQSLAVKFNSAYQDVQQKTAEEKQKRHRGARQRDRPESEDDPDRSLRSSAAAGDHTRSSTW